MLKAPEVQGQGQESTKDSEARRCLTPEEEAGVFEVDPWSGVLDDWAEELEHPFPYPAGLP